MNLLTDPWIPVRAEHGTGEFRLLTLEELLCEDNAWWVSIPRDDLELACIQLLVCIVQTMFMPKNNVALRERLSRTITSGELDASAKPCVEWFDLDHATWPFMQTRGVKGAETSLQKLLPGMPEKTSTSKSAHCFFNETSEVESICGPIAAIALFNQASNSPSFGGGKQGAFKGSLRGNAPVTTLVKGSNLRETVWRNVVTLPRIQDRLPGYVYDLSKDRPTWVDPIREKQDIHAHEIGLVRGLFWQPARVELVKASKTQSCDVLDDVSGVAYCSFRKKQFGFTVKELWHHPHGAMTVEKKKGKMEWKFVSFNRFTPAWTWLSEFVVLSPLSDDAKEGATPAAPVSQAAEAFPGEPLHLIVGGYQAKKALVEARCHELFTLAEGWDEERRGRVKILVELGKEARGILCGRLEFVARGDKKMCIKGIGVNVHETGNKLFYSSTETFFHETLRERLIFKEWQVAKDAFVARLASICSQLFDQITNPYAMKSELIPVIARERRRLNNDLNKLSGGGAMS